MMHDTCMPVLFIYANHKFSYFLDIIISKKMQLDRSKVLIANQTSTM